MFPSRYFNPRYWASRFWPKVGEDPPISGAKCYIGLVSTIKPDDTGFQSPICGEELNFGAHTPSGGMIRGVITTVSYGVKLGLGLTSDIDGSDTGLIGTINENIGLVTSFGNDITWVSQVSVTQSTLVGGIITLSSNGEPVGIGLTGSIDDSTTGAIGTICNC